MAKLLLNLVGTDLTHKNFVYKKIPLPRLVKFLLKFGNEDASFYRRIKMEKTPTLSLVLAKVLWQVNL